MYKKNKVIRMSTRAYLIEPEFVWIDEKRYVYEAETLLWNHTYNPEIWDVLYPYMNDFTNDECIGYIEITYDVWDSLKMDYMDRANQFGEKVYEKDSLLCYQFSYESEPMKRIYNIRNWRSYVYDGGEIFLNNGKTQVSIYFSPKAEVLTNQIRPLIQNSKESIHIAMYYLTHRRIVDDLIDAKNRGVDVKIILDGSFVRDGYAPHEKLREAGVPVKIENWRSKLHSKNAIFDGKIATLGSTNWTSTAELVNDDGTDNIKTYFLDWPTCDTAAGVQGSRALLVIALEYAIELLEFCNEKEVSIQCKSKLAILFNKSFLITKESVLIILVKPKRVLDK